MPVEHKQMIYHLIHEVTVVRNHYHAPLKVLKVFFKHLEGYDIEVVGRLVEHQEVGIAHQHRAQIQTAALTSAQLIHIAMLGFGSEEEMLQKLGGGEALSVSELYHFGYVLHHVNHLHLLVKLQSLLRIVTEAHGLAYVKRSLVGLLLAHQNLDEGRFSGTVVSHDTHLFVACEDV